MLIYQAADDSRFTRRGYSLRAGRTGTGKASGTLKQCRPAENQEV
jgi:hypothetical protein